MREKEGGGQDIVADKEFEIFDDIFVYGSRGNEGGNTDVGIHRRSIPSRKWTKYESESSPKFSPFSTVRYSAMSRIIHVENRMGLRATWPIASNTGAKSDPLSPRDKSKIWHRGDLPRKRRFRRKKVHKI